MQGGFSLLEVLITLAIISIGLLGLADSELQALREMRNITISNALMQQMDSLAEEMQFTTHPQVALAEWLAQLKLSWPFVTVQVTSSSNTISLKLQWQNNNENVHLQQTIYIPSRL